MLGSRSRAIVQQRPESRLVKYGTPSVSALSYLLPGLSPAIRNAVFLDTDAVTLPPRACTPPRPRPG